MTYVRGDLSIFCEENVKLKKEKDECNAMSYIFFTTNECHSKRLMSRPQIFVRNMSQPTLKEFPYDTCETVSKDFQKKPARIPFKIVTPGISATAASLPMYAKEPLCV